MSEKMKGTNQDRQTILVCCGTGCIANGGRKVYEAFTERIKDHPEWEVQPILKSTGCNGWCEKGPLVRIMPRDITYCSVTPKDVDDIVDKTLLEGSLIKRLLYRDPVTKEHLSSHHQTDFYRKQHKVALRNIGEIDPGRIEDYIEREGYQALALVLRGMSGQEVIDTVKAAGLRGRGGEDSPPVANGSHAKMPPVSPSTLSATETKAILARLWTEASWKVILTPL